MKTIKYYCPKPSDAIAAMIDGLTIAYYAPENAFKIDMKTYGTSIKNICFGCAATCTVQAAAGVTFDPVSIKTESKREISAGVYDIGEFEMAINSLRLGGKWDLADFYRVSMPHPNIDLPELNNYFTIEQLVPYAAYVDQLRAVNL